MTKLVAIVVSVTLAYAVALAQQRPLDGTYDARVRMESGTYRVLIEVENGEVTHIRWPNGARMSVRRAEIEDGGAIGWNSRGDRISIEIDDIQYESDNEGEEEESMDGED